jgi:hypothetical protein
MTPTDAQIESATRAIMAGFPSFEHDKEAAQQMALVVLTAAAEVKSMSDLIERLRKFKFPYTGGEAELIMYEAADEIERLRELVGYWHKQHDCEFELRHAEIERLKGLLDVAAIELEGRGDEIERLTKHLSGALRSLGEWERLVKERDEAIERCAQVAKEKRTDSSEIWGEWDEACAEIEAAILALKDEP